MRKALIALSTGVFALATSAAIDTAAAKSHFGCKSSERWDAANGKCMMAKPVHHRTKHMAKSDDKTPPAKKPVKKAPKKAM